MIDDRYGNIYFEFKQNALAQEAQFVLALMNIAHKNLDCCLQDQYSKLKGNSGVRVHFRHLYSLILTDHSGNLNVTSIYNHSVDGEEAAVFSAGSADREEPYSRGKWRQLWLSNCVITTLLISGAFSFIPTSNKCPSGVQY